MGLLVMEFIVRALNIPPVPLDPIPIPSYQLSENPILGYEYRQNYNPSDIPFDISHKGHATNSEGFRDYEYNVDKPEELYRTLILGDSTTAGNGITSLDKIYSKQLEKLLNKNSNTNIRHEVLNLGVGGYHTLQEVETLRTKGIKYKPDLVILTFCLNDFDLNSDGGVYETLLKNNPTALEATLFSFSYTLLRYSRLAFILHHSLQTHDTDYTSWYTQNILKNKTPVEVGLTLLSALQLDYEFTAYVLILPAFTHYFHDYRFKPIHKNVIKITDKLSGITTIDLLSHFSNIDLNATKFSYDGVHLNEYGHKTMAEILLPIVETNCQIALSRKHKNIE